MPARGKSGSTLPPGSVEVELGVPIPGVILAPGQWTPSALKRWPAAGAVNWKELFARQAPVVLDLGCGNGRSVLLGAIARPQCDFLGVDDLPVVIRYARKRARQRGLANVRFAVGDARDVVARRVAPASVAEVHVYHPQPYYDRRQVHRRLITPRFLMQVHRALTGGGMLVLQTDNPAYWDYMRRVVPAFFALTEHPAPWPDALQGRTRREIIALSRGLPIFRALCQARTDIDPQEAVKVAAALPEPIFNADRRLMELDRIERETGAEKKHKLGHRDTENTER